MIKPHKYLDLTASVINVSSIILAYLLEVRIAKYDDIYKKVEIKLGKSAISNFLPALSLLFLLDKIYYHSESDSLELIK